MTPRNFLLFLSATHCEVRTWRNGELSAARHFPDSAEGREGLTALLRSARAPVLMLADLAEEDFRQETVLHLRGGERAALIGRKLEQYYRSTPFRQARLLRRRGDGRRDDDMLFSALTNPAPILPWLDAMLEHGIPLAGIYSVPNVSVALVRDVPAANLLLLSWERHAGLRQTYFCAGQLSFSRLTPVNDGSSLGVCAATEIARTQQYLRNRSLLSPGQPLDVRIVCHAGDRREFEAHMHDDAERRHTCLDIEALGRSMGAKAACTDSDAAPLFLHLLATHPPRSHYASAGHTRFLSLLRLRHGLHGLSAAMAMVCLVWSGANLRHGLAMQDAAASLKTQVAVLAQQTRQVSAGFPAAQAPAAEMKSAVLLVRKIDAYLPPPQAALEDVSRALDEFPRVRIDRLSWDTEAASAAQLVTLGGELEGYADDYRGALDYLERFRQALARLGYSTATGDPPLDIAPQGSISADDGNARAARFSLKLRHGAAA